MSEHTTDRAHADHVHEHPTWKQYKWIALWLTLITMVEVWVYYTPFQHSPLFPPALLAMSAVKFVMVIMYYMHLKFDNPLFKRLFYMGLGIAVFTVTALLFLFGKLKIGG